MDEDTTQDGIRTSYCRSQLPDEYSVGFPIKGQIRNSKGTRWISVPGQQQVPLSPEPVSSPTIACKCALPVELRGELNAWVRVLTEYLSNAAQQLSIYSEPQSSSSW
jgi:hypothetical protein